MSPFLRRSCPEVAHLQKGEMHKRRLAIVVRTSRGVCQVVPVTSDSPGVADKTSFQLSRPTLDQLTFWGSSGKDSWAICQMVESVSVNRILPPVTEYQARGQTRRGRNTHYTLRLAEAEKALLRNSLLHSIGVTDYQQTKTKLSETREQLQELTAAATDLEAANAVSLRSRPNEKSYCCTRRSPWIGAKGSEKVSSKPLSLICERYTRRWLPRVRLRN